MVVVVSEDFVDQYFGAGTQVHEVLGREVEPVMLVRGPATVVGVVRATRHHGPDAPTFPSVYIPFTQQVTVPVGSLLLKGDADRLVDPVGEVLGLVAPHVQWTPLLPYSSYLSEWYAPFRFQITMIGVLAGLGLLLASLGLYALMAYQVTIDGKELGIRKALGARDSSLMLRVVGRGAAMALIGATIGLAAWYQLLPALGVLVEGIESGGYLVPLSVALVVGGSCLLATAVPALRATRVDVLMTLKTD
jgi:ABC-type antimicrobial peptide transport system permease subunit